MARLSSWRRRVVGEERAGPLALLTTLHFTDTLGVATFALLLPEIRDYFGVSITRVQVVVTIAALLPLLLSVPIGFLSDRAPRSIMLGVAFVLSGIFSIGTALAPGLILLGVMRLGAGLGNCFEGSSQSLMSDTYSYERRGAVVTVLSMATPAGACFGPLLAGYVGERYGWQLPFLIAGIPTLLLAGFAFGLRNPPRGVQERRALGADESAALTEDAPPGWTEGWRVARSVRTLVRLWASLPFLVGAGLVVARETPFLLHDVFHLSTSQRGLVVAAQYGAALIALLLLTPALSRLTYRAPARMVTFGGLLATVAAALLLVMAVSPWLWLTVAALVAIGIVTAPLAPIILALVSLTVPARARGFALSFGSLFVALGLFVNPFVAALAEEKGVRWGIGAIAPVFVIGALIVASAGASVASDIRAATAAAMAGEIVRRSREEGRVKLLVCRDVDAGYGQVQILFNVDFEVEEGEIVALLGTNGAGKSTLLSVISGSNPASNGAVLFDGEPITQLPAAEHISRGIVSVPGGKAVCPGLTVAENLDLALWATSDDTDAQQRLQRVYDLFPRLLERRSEPAGNLSGGEQQMLALSQAFLVRPRLLMIDELSLGLAPAVVQQLLEIVREIHEEGATIILVEQSVNVALTVAQRAVFMEKGEVRFSGPTAELLDRPDVLRSVFLSGAGSASGSYARGRKAQPTAESEDSSVVLRVTDVERSFGGVQALRGATFELRAGETLGIIGPNGAGKTTLFDVISGFVPPTAGTVELLGEDITDLSPERRALLGLGRSFQDARLFPALTVEEVLLVTLDRHHQAKSFGSTAFGLPKARRAEAVLRRRAERLMMLLGITDLRDKFVRELSTGSRRLVDLACVLAGDPDVLLLDEPSSGIAQKETEELPALLDRIKFETGCALLIIEHDMQLISAVSDELLAMELGRVVLRGAPADVLHDPRVVAAYLGTDSATIHRSGQPAGPRPGVPL